MDSALPTAAQIQAWPLASVQHFDAAGQLVSAAQAVAVAVLYIDVLKNASAAKEVVVSLLANASTIVETTQRRLAIAGRAIKGVYDDANPDLAPSAPVAKIGCFESQMDQLEPFLTAIVEANEQARAKITAQESEKAELSAQLAQANQHIRQLTQQLSAAVDTKPPVKPRISALDRRDAPQETAAKTQAAAMTMTALTLEVAVSSPVQIAEEEDESEDDASLTGGDQADDDLNDMEAFHQYVLLKDEATMEWSQVHQAANASAFAVVSAAVTSDMVGCGPDGLCLRPAKTTEHSPKLVARLQANQGLLLVGASEDAIAKLPLDWFTAVDTSKLSLLERRAINMALLAPALMFWLPEFPVCPQAAQKFMWFRDHLDSLMELSEEDDSPAQEHSSDWSDAEYLAAASVAACATKHDDSDVSTASEDED